MKVYLHGHTYQYAVEQTIATLFPGEKTEYTEDRETAELSVILYAGTKFTTVGCTYRAGGGMFHGRAAVQTSRLTDAVEQDRLCQFIIKSAIYRAARTSGLPRPPWGALTGVRPGKLMHSLIREGASSGQTIRRFIREYDVTKERAELCYETSLATLRAEDSLRERDLCLYIGIPFCPTRCAYCSFVSQSVGKSMALIDRFLEALLLEIRANAAQVKRIGGRVVTVYAGGGTPTTLSAQQLDRLCSAVETEFDLSALREYTVEAGRPDTITPEKLQVLHAHGVNRVSVNPQTMDDAVLAAIGRRHTAQDILTALEMVKECGGMAVNMDLIAGLPEDTVQGFARSLNTVLALSPENITVHTLSLKKGSGLMLGKKEIPSPAAVGEMLAYAYPKLRENGYAPYYLYRQKNMSGGFENTGWTKPGHENLYNICMMEELCTILASGGGGSTKLIHPGGGKNIRLTAPKYPLEYIQQIETTCKNKERIGEFYGV